MQLADRIYFTAGPPAGVSAVTVQTVGTPGLTHYYYWVVVQYFIGNVVTGPFEIWNAPDVLDSNNYVHVVGEPPAQSLPGFQLYYALLRTDTPELPTTINPPPQIQVPGGPTFPEFLDQGASLYPYYGMSSLVKQSPAFASIILNNKDFAQPALQISGALQAPTITGYIQNLSGIATAPAGMDIASISGTISIHSDNPPGQIVIHGANSVNLACQGSPNGSSSLDLYPTYIQMFGPNINVYCQTSINFNGWGSNMSLGGGFCGIGIQPGAYRLDVRGEVNVSSNSTWDTLFHIDDAGNVSMPMLPTVAPAAGSKMLWADPADGYSIKLAN